uniref:Uncharacterized protein n=1 Tax=Rhizophora mucronata TaxID=61149 RepID=A0A2P2QN40_RHIMU
MQLCLIIIFFRLCFSCSIPGMCLVAQYQFI